MYAIRRKLLVFTLPTAALLLILSYSLDLRPPAHLYRYIGRPISDPYQAAEVQQELLQTTFTLPNQNGTATRTAQDRLVDAAKVIQLKEEILATHKDEEENHRIDWTTATLDRLAACLGNDTCGTGEETVVVLGSFHFKMAYLGATSGEDIWAHSTMASLAALNVTALYLPNAALVHLAYLHIPHLIQLIIWEGEQLRYCLNQGEGQIRPESALKECIKREGYQEGIPIWKGVVFHFWGDAASPLGGGWTVSPYDYGRVEDGANRYLGYSIERECMQRSAFRPSQRLHRAMVLGKNKEYFEIPKMAFPGSLNAAANGVPAVENRTTGDPMPFRFATTADPGEHPEEFPEYEVMEFIPTVHQAGWFQELGQSKVLVGIGWPEWSPSPFDALCMAVPFINVIKVQDEEDPEDRDKWMTQHNGLKHLSPPYIYHVHQGNGDELGIAIKSAVAHPIERHIPGEMSFASVVGRHRDMLELDWMAEAEAVWDSKVLMTADGHRLLL